MRSILLPNRFLLSLFIILALLVVSIHGKAQPKYEFRGVWVATVDNIDWPSSKFLGSDSQKVEFTKLLDMHRRNGMNAIIAQIRPATDAFYPSQYEPWSEWLRYTGTPTYALLRSPAIYDHRNA